MKSRIDKFVQDASKAGFKIETINGLRLHMKHYNDEPESFTKFLITDTANGNKRGVAITHGYGDAVSILQGEIKELKRSR